MNETHTSRARKVSDWFRPPDLTPCGVALEPLEVAPSVYALLADRPPVNNSGFIVGERGVLVVDAHINGCMARQIQDAIRAVTDKPLLYLVITSDRGDHHFGSYAFPEGTRIVTQRLTAAAMRDFDGELAHMRWILGSSAGQLDEVVPRCPDILFDQSLTLDLGDLEVEVHRFGPGESRGDSVVYLRDAELAFTGNLVRAEGSVPCLVDTSAVEFRRTIRRFRDSLALRMIIPGHGVLGTAAALDLYEQYLDLLLEKARGLVRRGLSPEALSGLADELCATFATPREPIEAELVRGTHRLNVETTCRQLLGDGAAGVAEPRNGRS